MAESSEISQTVLPLGRSVSIEQAARLLHLSRRTIYNRIRDGRLRTVRTIGGSQRVLVDSLHELGLTSPAFTSPGPAIPAGPVQS